MKAATQESLEQQLKVYEMQGIKNTTCTEQDRCNHRTWEAKVKRVRVQGQPGLHETLNPNHETERECW